MSGKRNFLLFLTFIIAVSLAAGGSYYYVAQQYDKRLNAKTGDIARLQEINGRLNKQLEDIPVREVVLEDLKFFVPKEWKMEENEGNGVKELIFVITQSPSAKLVAEFNNKTAYELALNDPTTKKIKEWELSEGCSNENTIYSSCGLVARVMDDTEPYLLSVTTKTKQEIDLYRVGFEYLVSKAVLTK